MIPNAYRGKLREALNEGGSETIIYVNSLETINGETLDFSKFTPYRGILTIDPYGEYPEWVSFTGINTANNSFTGVTRGLSALDDTVIAGNKFFHPEETDVVLAWGVHNVKDIPEVTVDSVNSQTGTVVLDADDIDDTSTTHKFVTATDLTNLSNLSGTNTGDQTSIVGITGTMAQFDTAVSDGDLAYQNRSATFSSVTTSGAVIPAIIQGGTGAASTAVAGAQYLGSTNTGYHWRNGALTLTPTAGYNYTSLNLLSQSITEAASGTHALIANLAIGALDITNGAGATTNAATLYIEGPATGTATPTNSYALWVDDGVVKFDAPGNASGSAITTDATQTLTNKRITKRVVTTTDDATAVIDVDVTDVYQLSAVANATTFTLTGTPTDGQTLMIRFKDAGVAKALTWTGFTAIGVALPTTTVAGKWHYVGCQYNSAASAWHAIAVGVEA